MNIFRPLFFQFRFLFWAPFLSLKNFFKTFFHKKGNINTPDKDLALFESQAGQLKCVGCKLCEVACPAQAIIIDTWVDEKGHPYPSRFDIDMTKCITCGICEQACPVNAIGFVSRRVLSVDEKDKLYYTKDTLIHNGKPDLERPRS
jgi:formate hydrogenlyase subunit 6/NADH:ubiquinone oxidoreductase subunit I